MNVCLEKLQQSKEDLEKAQKAFNTKYKTIVDELERAQEVLCSKYLYVLYDIERLEEQVQGAMAVIGNKKRKREEEDAPELNLDSFTLENFQNPTKEQAGQIADRLIHVFKFQEAKRGANKFSWYDLGQNAGPASETHRIHQSVLDAIKDKTDVCVENVDYSLTFEIRVDEYVKDGNPIVEEDDIYFEGEAPDFNFETPMDRIMTEPEAYFDIETSSPGERWVTNCTIEGEVYKDCDFALDLDEDFTWKNKKIKYLGKEQ